MVLDRADPGGKNGQRRQLRILRLTFAAMVLAGVAAALLDPGVLCAVPALVLPLALLVLGRYPGEQALLTMSAARRAHPKRAAAGSPLPRVTPPVPPRGGQLIARSLANRPPPRLSLVAV